MASPKLKTTIAILGCGDVGSTLAYTLILQPICHNRGRETKDWRITFITAFQKLTYPGKYLWGHGSDQPAYDFATGGESSGYLDIFCKEVVWITREPGVGDRDEFGFCAVEGCFGREGGGSTEQH